MGRVAAALLALLALHILAAVVALGISAPAAAGDPEPVSEADEQLLIKVRQAGLWEIPTGQQAQQRASSQIVKDVGAHLAEEHIKLDEEVRTVAARLGVDLPSQASDEQQGWMAELSTKSGPEYDQVFADRLRAAHGKVFLFVAQVRSGTRNDEIRALAQKANDIVKRHMTLLESTGLVNFEALPEPVLPPPPSGAAPAGTLAPATSIPPADATHGQHVVAAAAETDTGGGGGLDVGLVVAICVVEAGVTVGLLRLFRSR